MKVITLITVFMAFACLNGFSQATVIRVTGIPANPPVIDKIQPHNPDATIYTIDFEQEVEWTFDFLPWTVNDADGLDTYGFANYDFPHEYEPMAFIVFNPATTTPTMSGDPEIQPHSGAQFGACMASVPSGGQGNDDWFISDLIEIGADSKGASFTFWAKTYDDTRGLERFNVGVSTTGNDPSDFTIISGSNYIEAPTTWTEYSYDLSNYAGQSIYIAIQCVFYDAFVFMIDDLVISPGVIPQDCDYFDNYVAGQLLCPQSNGLWTTWDDNPGGPYDGYVSDAQYLTPPNSLGIVLA